MKSPGETHQEALAAAAELEKDLMAMLDKQRKRQKYELTGVSVLGEPSITLMPEGATWTVTVTFDAQIKGTQRPFHIVDTGG